MEFVNFLNDNPRAESLNPGITVYIHNHLGITASRSNSQVRVIKGIHCNNGMIRYIYGTLGVMPGKDPGNSETVIFQNCLAVSIEHHIWSVALLNLIIHENTIRLTRSLKVFSQKIQCRVIFGDTKIYTLNVEACQSLHTHSLLEFHSPLSA